MSQQITMHEDRLFPAEPSQRAVAKRLYETIKALPIISPHGHTDPTWYAQNINFPNPTALFITPDHYLFRMLYSQGVSMDDLGVPRADGSSSGVDPRQAWRVFAEHFHLFRGTPTRFWFEDVLTRVFDIYTRLAPDTADEIYDAIDAKLSTPEFKVRALYDRFNIEAISTTDSPLDDLAPHQAVLEDSSWDGRIVPAYRPDNVVDPEFEGFAANVEKLGELTGENTATWNGYLKALAQRREFFITMGCTSTDHGHPTARTANLDASTSQSLLDSAMAGTMGQESAELFRAQMLTEMAKMSLDDGLVMQIHPGSSRNHNQQVFQKFGRDKGADIPLSLEYVEAIKPLLDVCGNEPGLTVILFAMDESVYSRELAPLAGHYPALRLGPPWWFLDSPEAMIRFRRSATETAGFYNTVGFNDDTRAFLSIPARHDVARRVDCAFLSELVCTHRLDEDEAAEVAVELAYKLVKKAYNL